MAYVLDVFDAKSRFSELIDRAARGEETVITRHGRPVARIVPERKPKLSPAEQAEIIGALRDLRRAIGARGERFTREDIRALRDEGRLAEAAAAEGVTVLGRGAIG